MLVDLAQHADLAHRLCASLDTRLADIELRRFPDGETYLRYHCDLKGRDIALLCSLDDPNAKVIDVIFAAATARDLGARSVGLIAPYLAYMRQDALFHPGEGLTSAYFGKLLSAWVDWVVTVDPHLHRRKSLNEIYSIPSSVVHAAPLLAAWIAGHVERPLLIGPDSESEQWVSSVAREAGAPYEVLEKVRRGDRDVSVSVPDVAGWQDHTPVLVDDIISSGRTMLETLAHLEAANLRPAVCIGVHGLFAGDAYSALKAARIEMLVTTNSIPHPTNRIDLSGILAAAARKRFEVMAAPN